MIVRTSGSALICMKSLTLLCICIALSMLSTTYARRPIHKDSPINRIIVPSQKNSISSTIHGDHASPPSPPPRPPLNHVPKTKRNKTSHSPVFKVALLPESKVPKRLATHAVGHGGHVLKARGVERHSPVHKIEILSSNTVIPLGRMAKARHQKERLANFNTLHRSSIAMSTSPKDMMVNFVDGAYPVFYMPGSANGRFNGKIRLLVV